MREEANVALTRICVWRAGNWVGTENAPGLLREGDPNCDGEIENWESVRHAVSDANAILSVTSDSEEPGGPVTEPFVHDRAGNLVLGRLGPGGAAVPAVTYYLQDANYNVVALMDEGGPSVPPAVLAQYVWSPYGDVVVKDEFPGDPPQPLPVDRIWHRGLFFYRLDGPPDGVTGGPGALAPYTAGLYCNRNRWYSPHLGRFTSLDPNETALAVIGALATNGETLDSSLGSFNSQDHFSDGMNLYQYVGSNPIKHIDPSGLESDYDPFEEVGRPHCSNVLPITQKE